MSYFDPTMPRGRPRKHDPTLPGHIDREKIPRGLYWAREGQGRWYAFETGPNGRQRKVTVAGRDARLSDLHAVAEKRAGQPATGSVAAVLGSFHEHREFKSLAVRTRGDYALYARQIKTHPTKAGRFGDVLVSRLSPPTMRVLIDQIADGEGATPGFPTKANHWLRYLRRVFAWGIQYGHCRENPCAGVECVPEVRDSRMPDRQVFRAAQAFAQERGQLGARERGALPVYLWCAMELAYQWRLRGIEVLTLTDAHVEAKRGRTNRRKGSRDNAPRIGPRTREAIEALQARRAAIWGHEKRGKATPILPEDRPLFVGEDGLRLSRSGFNTAWTRLIAAAVAAGVLTRERRFGLHGLKHRGVTDTPGDKGAKQAASGHRSERMVDHYDHEIPAVEPTDDAEIASDGG